MPALQLILRLFASTLIVQLATAANLAVLPYGAFQGTTSGNVTKFLGMPFAQPPVGNLRFARPLPPKSFLGIKKADSWGNTCPQQALSQLPGITITPKNYTISEDCLTISVVTPKGVSSGAKLPVFFWIFGGGFEIGGQSDTDPTPMVERSIAIGQPMIMVVANYRVNALGFLAGEQVRKAGVANLGLRDQILAMDWVQKYISTFGGDPSKVTIGGISAGAISVATHLLNNAGTSKPKAFRAAFMQSGAPAPTDPVVNGQAAYDQIVRLTACNNATDTLACLRTVPLDNLMAAVNTTRNQFSYSSIANDWRPRVDGDIVKDNPIVLAKSGQFAKVPMISGNCEDEGTFFSLSSLNVTTDDAWKQYIQTFYLPNATAEQMDALATAYPSDPSQGAPFNTGLANAVTPEYKRMAAIQGDIAFIGPRRLLLQTASQSGTTVYSYLCRRDKQAAIVGAHHAADTADWAGLNATDHIGTDALIRFITTLNPNSAQSNAQGTEWPKYTTASPQMFTFDDFTLFNITTDTFRQQPIELLGELTAVSYR